MQVAPNLLELNEPRWRFSDQLPPYHKVQPVITTEQITVGDFLSRINIAYQQISGSLQHLRITEPPRGLPSSDPYRAPVGYCRQVSVVVPILAIEPTGQCARPTEEIDVALLASALDAAPKIVASFVGRVGKVFEDFASVVLINEETGERLDSRCDAELLRENRIGAGDEFRCEVQRSKGVTTTRLFRLPPKTVSKERVDQIRAAFKGRWTF